MMHPLYLLLCLSVSFVSLFGVMGDAGVRRGHVRPIVFCYYTTLSNLLTGAYHLLLPISFLLFPDGLYRFLASPAVHMSVALCVTLTFLVFHFMLWPAMKKDPGPHFSRLDNFCVHYLGPWLTVLVWLLFADKQGLTFAHAAAWLVLPLAYLVFALVRAVLGPPFYKNGPRYPYPFMDFDRLGTVRAGLNCLGLCLGCFALGCLFVLAARLIG